MTDKPVSFTGPAGRLEGVLHTPEGGPHPGVAVCHPHPLYGGDMNNNVVMAAVRGLLDKGIAALRFNFRGSGGSEGAHDGGVGEREDALAALVALRESDGVDAGRIGLAGYSFGAGVAVGAAPADSQVQALAAVAPPTSALGAPEVLAFERPKLFIAGGMDSFMPIDQMRSIVGGMAGPAELVVLEGADHFFSGYELEIATAVGDFFAGSLTP